MQRLQSFPLNEPTKVKKLRRAAAAVPHDHDTTMTFGLALCEAGCSYEAASFLRPLRSHWKASEQATAAQAALDAQAWWNKHWKNFVQLCNSGKPDAALALLGARAVHFWDFPPLLMHLGEIAAKRGHLDLANHIFTRVANLAERGLPKMNMAAFTYVAQSAIIDVLCKQGHAAAALDRHRAIEPNPGNAMAHEIQHTQLLVASGHLEEAMRQVARSLVTARKHRTGYSRMLRVDFIDHAPELAPLRCHSGWKQLLQDPETYLRAAQAT